MVYPISLPSLSIRLVSCCQEFKDLSSAKTKEIKAQRTLSSMVCSKHPAPSIFWVYFRAITRITHAKTSRSWGTTYDMIIYIYIYVYLFFLNIYIYIYIYIYTYHHLNPCIFSEAMTQKSPRVCPRP